MIKDETFYSLTDVINNIPDNYRILEDSIDIDVQSEYYASSTELVFDSDTDSLEHLIDTVLGTGYSVAEQKIALQKLALIDKVEAFRAIEKFNQNPLPELKSWAVLAYQQSLMVIHSSLLDEQQVFISTGLGGKGDKLRYFIVFPYKTVDMISPVQQKALSTELDFFIGQYNGILENLDFFDLFATATVLFPLKEPIYDMVNDILEECNNIGDFLTDNILITNMKILDHEEIENILKEYERE